MEKGSCAEGLENLLTGTPWNTTQPDMSSLELSISFDTTR